MSSPFTSVTNVSCANCTTKYYDPGLSSSKNVGYPGFEKTTFVFVDHQFNFTGKVMTDNVCLDPKKPNTCVENFGFFLISG